MGITDIGMLVAGLGLFLYGMHILADSLEKVAGSKLKGIINKLTSNRFIAIVLGAAVTILVQSSSTSTVMVVGLVNSGLMTIKQCVGVIMGANIGTTTTAWIASSSGTSFSTYVPFILGLGAFISLFSKNKKRKNIALILVGFGILFIGMDIMKDAVKPLREVEFFTDIMKQIGDYSFANIMLGILVGAIFTIAVQSSSASTAVFIALASSNIIGLTTAIPLIYGANIGTCITAVLASIGASKAAKQASTVHVLFNLIGTLIFLPFTVYLARIAESIASSVEVQIAVAHTIFNVGSTLILIWFAPTIANMATKIIKNEDEEDYQPVLLDEMLLSTPSVAYDAVEKEIINLGKIAIKCLKNSICAFTRKDYKYVEKTLRYEKAIDESEYNIYDYILKLTNEDGLTDKDKNMLEEYIKIIHDFERIGDHSENIAQLSENCLDKKLFFSELAIEEAEHIFSNVLTSCEESLLALEKKDSDIAQMVIKREDIIDKEYKNTKQSHVKRLKSNECSIDSGILFIEVLTNLERIADHAYNISKMVVEKENS